MRTSEKNLFAATAYSAALGAFTVLIVLGSANMAFKYVSAKCAYLERQAEANRMTAEKMIGFLNERLEEAAKTREAEDYLAPDHKERERPEDRRTWASYDPEPQDMPLAQLPEPDEEETPISTARLDAMLPPATPAMPY